MIASTTGAVTTTLGGPLGDALTGAPGGAGGGVMNPLTPVQGAATQLAGTLGGNDPAAALGDAVSSLTGALGNLGGTNPLVPVQGR